MFVVRCLLFVGCWSVFAVCDFFYCVVAALRAVVAFLVFVIVFCFCVLFVCCFVGVVRNCVCVRILSLWFDCLLPVIVLKNASCCDGL